MFPLNQSCPKKTYCVMDCPDHPRLEALGIHSKGCFTCVSHSAFKGPVIVEVNKRQIAIDHQLARKIRVKEWTEDVLS
ncbi:FeoA domain-containing protein [Pelagirhabdus alkalitolerans]|uniref:FeoA domain-containing protein n=1 Tax=Pelagirhabdus alkalitolerans TaxID=1612202 RepID=A0A1G6GPW6_9BACI|nr:FeoA family protein [Pelagirhabdus alkalitolerans]SDB84007.1 FeoA domain-containing protein [Pelagirhabdus alkalitolerans]